jgi:TRAP-type uncharacterized transport system substrate-binding protein
MKTHRIHTCWYTSWLSSIALLFVVLFTLFGCTHAHAEPQKFLLSDGSSSGTYAAFLAEIQSVTGDIVTFVEIPSSGAVENIDNLLNNKVSGAFAHSDVLQFKAQARDLSQYKTLLSLFKEEVHFIALTTSKRVTGSHFGFGGHTAVISTLDDLRGCKVGAAGGGFITVQVIKALTGTDYEVVQYDNGKAVLAALANGDIDAAEFTGGAPLPNLVDLGPDYKLLSIPDHDMGPLSQVYSPATLTYSKMSPTAVQTVAADCLFVAREYKKTPRLIQLLKDVRTAFYAHLGELQETPGAHPKWQEVDPKNHGKWAWMDLGDVDDPPTPVAPTPAPGYQPPTGFKVVK